VILDGLLTFTGTSNGASGGITSGPQTDFPTAGTQDASNIVDLGLSGLPTPAGGGGARDISSGDCPMMKLLATVTTAFAGGTNLTLELQGAPDNGSGAPGAFTVMWTGQTFAEAALIQGCYLANVDLPRVLFEQVLPRFLKMTFVSTGTHTAGGVEGQVVLDRFDQVIGTTGALSNYPPGITILN
jgi:hypothetical protein